MWISLLCHYNFKNTAKFVLNKGTQNWPFLVSVTPSDPVLIHKHLKKSNVRIQTLAWHEGELIDLGFESGLFQEYERLVLIAVKH